MLCEIYFEGENFKLYVFYCKKFILIVNNNQFKIKFLYGKLVKSTYVIHKNYFNVEVKK